MDDHLHDLAHLIAILLFAIFLTNVCIIYYVYSIANPVRSSQPRSWPSTPKSMSRLPRLSMPAWLSSISIKVPSFRVILYPIIWIRRLLWKRRRFLVSTGLIIILVVATLSILPLVEWGNGKFQVIVDSWPREQIGKILGGTGVDMTAKDKEIGPIKTRSKFIIEQIEKEKGGPVDPKYRPSKRQYELEDGN